MTRQRFAIVSLVVLLTALVVLLTATAETKAVDKNKLRQAACLPLLTALTGVHVYDSKFSLEPKRPLPEQIATLRKKLKAEPANVEVYIRLGAVYAKAGNQNESQEAYTKAVELCRRQLEQHPDDISARLSLSEALQGLGKDDEAESLIRQAVKDAPENWRYWLELADVLGTKSLKIIMNNKPLHYSGPETLLQAMRAAQPTTETFAAAQPYRKEAAACFERAIDLAPREAKVYWRRSVYNGLFKDIERGFRMYKGEKVDPLEIFLPPPDALEDLRRVADLSGEDYVAIGGATSYEFYTVATEYQLHHPSNKQPPKLIDVLPEATRKRLLDNLKRLEKGMRGPDKHKAAVAAFLLGGFQGGILEDEQAAEKSLRRSLELDPGLDDASDMLIAMLASAHRYTDALKLSRERLNLKDSAHNRLNLAKAYEGLNQLAKAEEEIRAGLKLDPDNFMLNLALADIFMMRGQDDDLQKAGELLCKVEKDYNPGAIGENRWINYSYSCGIYYALIGDVEEARRRLEAVRKRYPEYPRIEEALHALDEWCSTVDPAPQSCQKRTPEAGDHP